MTSPSVLTSLPLLDKIQYRILRRLAPAHRGRLDGSAYAGKSKLRVLLGDDILQRLAAADTVIDFGCGDGVQSVEMALMGCRHVVGVDIRESILQRGREHAQAAGLAERCEFTRTPKPADAVVSIDSFEHFDEPTTILHTMHEMLCPGGRVYISFGPTWYHPLGGHLFSIFPWAHLVFSEAALCAWRSHLRNDGATRFADVEGGLNQITIGQFERIVANSPFVLEFLECVPIRKFQPLHNRLTREWTTSIVRAILQRRG